MIKKCLKTALCFVLLSYAGTTLSNELTFREAKKHMPSIFSKLEKATTLYCGCDIIFYSNKGYKPDLESCGYKIRKNEKRAKRIEAEHIMPAHEFGHKLQCWIDGGRNNCTEKDDIFEKMQSDLHNLYPAVGEVNADRTNFKFTESVKGSSPYGQCRVIINRKKHIVQIPDRAKGIVARAYLYMSSTYKIPLSDDQVNLFNYRNKKFKVTKDECLRNELIKEIQGNDNPFVKAKCK